MDRLDSLSIAVGLIWTAWGSEDQAVKEQPTYAQRSVDRIGSTGPSTETPTTSVAKVTPDDPSSRVRSER